MKKTGPSYEDFRGIFITLVLVSLMIGFPKSGSSREVLSCLDLITLGCSSLHSFYCPTRGTARVVVGRLGNTECYTASD